MTASHIEILVEEPSMEAFLNALLPRLLPQKTTFKVLPFQGKPDMLEKLEARLRAYEKWLPQTWRIVVVVDRDNDDCLALKQRLEDIARRVNLRTRSAVGNISWQLVTRIVIEELESWYFGDWQAVCAAYPGVDATVGNSRKYRNPDSIQGGTWEAFERVLQKSTFRLLLPPILVLMMRINSSPTFEDSIPEAKGSVPFASAAR